jgi:hypothetical protein
MPLLHQELGRKSAALRHLRAGVLGLTAEHSLDRKQNEAVLGDRATQLVKRGAGVVQLLEQLAPALPRAVVLEPL